MIFDEKNWHISRRFNNKLNIVCYLWFKHSFLEYLYHRTIPSRFQTFQSFCSSTNKLKQHKSILVNYNTLPKMLKLTCNNNSSNNAQIKYLPTQKPTNKQTGNKGKHSYRPNDEIDDDVFILWTCERFDPFHVGSGEEIASFNETLPQTILKHQNIKQWMSMF